MSYHPTQHIGRPQPLVKHRSQGSSLRSTKSRTGLYAFPVPDTSSIRASVKSSSHSSDIASTFSQMLLHVEAMRSSFRAFAPHGVTKAARPYLRTVKNLIAQLNRFPSDFRPSISFNIAQYGVLVAVDTFFRVIQPIQFSDPNLQWLMKRAEDRLDMSITAIYSLLQLSIHELEECSRKQEESHHSSQTTLLMSAEQEAAHRCDETDRPLSYFVDKAAACSKEGPSQSQKPRTRKNTLLNTIRKISHLSLRRADSTAAIIAKDPTQVIHSSSPLPRSKCKGNLMLGNIRHSIASIPKPMRDSMARFVAPSAPLMVETGSEVPYTEYLPDGSLYRANIRGLVSVITSSCGAENQEFVAMVLMTFRLFTDASRLAEALLLRYKERPPAGLRKDKMYEWIGVSERVKQRVVIVLHQWLEYNWKSEDLGAMETLFLLANNYIGHDSIPDRDALLGLLNTVKSDPHYHGKRYLSPDCPVPTTSLIPLTPFGLQVIQPGFQPLAPEASSILAFASPDGIEEFARQLTMRESEFYHSTCPDDYVHVHRADGMSRRAVWIAYNGRFSCWVIDCFISPKTACERAKVFEFWVSVAKKCAEMRNYCTSYVIYNALKSDITENMTCTTREISIKCIKALRSLIHLFDQENWWIEMSLSNQPAIPAGYITFRWRKLIEEAGTKFLTRRTFTHKQPMSKFISQGRIDVDAFLNLADLIWEMEYTYGAHNFSPIPWVQRFIIDSTNNGKYVVCFETEKGREGSQKDSALLGKLPSWEAILDRVRHRRIRPMPLEDPKNEKPKKRRDLAAPPLPVDATAQIARATA